MVTYNDVDYFYVYNLQGDVVALIDANGTQVVEYGYDAWGYPISKTGSLAATIGTLNPFRYRGYVYDEETGLYYLRSRYYNPGWKRFVNADRRLGEEGEWILGHDSYTYCFNNPVSLIDPSVVHVFDAEGDPPLSMIQQREAATEVMGEFEEINTRPAIRAYFNRLLWVKGDDALDEKRILNGERACTFRKTAEAFRLIDADTCTVYVPNEGNAEDIAQLRAGLYSRALIRRLGRSSVNVYQNEYKNLVFAGIVEDHQEDGFGILIQPDAYKPKCGLSTEAGDGFLAK